MVDFRKSPFNIRRLTMPVATIIRDRNGAVHVRISADRPTTGGDIKVIDVMIGGDADELRDRAHEFAKRQNGYASVSRKKK